MVDNQIATKSNVAATPRFPPGPRLLSHKECKQRMKHMLTGGPGARVFLACLRERMNALNTLDSQHRL